MKNGDTPLGQPTCIRCDRPGAVGDDLLLVNYWDGDVRHLADAALLLAGEAA